MERTWGHGVKKPLWSQTMRAFESQGLSLLFTEISSGKGKAESADRAILTFSSTKPFVSIVVSLAIESCPD